MAHGCIKGVNVDVFTYKYMTFFSTIHPSAIQLYMQSGYYKENETKLPGFEPNRDGFGRDIRSYEIVGQPRPHFNF